VQQSALKTTPGPEQVFIGRQSIVDTNRRLAAYELLFRDGSDNRAVIWNDLMASATVISRAFSELGIEAALGPYPGFINCSAELLLSDMLLLLPKQKIVLEILETVDITPQIVERIKYLRGAGFTIALDDYTGEEKRYAAVLPLINIVKVDLTGLGENALTLHALSLKKSGIRLLAEKVDSEQQFELCRKLGFDYFQGYFFARPVVIAGKRLSHSEASLLRLLGLIVQDAETADIEDVFKQEPGLSLNLMRLTNSVGSGAAWKITSLRDAIVRLGRTQLQRWLQLLMFTNPSNGTAGPLLQTAATRGRLIELLAGEVAPGNNDLHDSAFMTGILSLVPAILGIPLAEVLKPLPVSAEVRAALEQRAGVLGTLLAIAESVENAPDAAPLAQSLGKLPALNADTLNRLQMQALAWANNIRL